MTAITAPPMMIRPALWALVGGAALAIGTGLATILWPEPTAMAGSGPVMVDYTLPDGRLIHVQTQEVTLTDWNLCYAAGACAMELRPPVGRAGPNYPATGLSFVDAMDYVRWISDVTGQDYRLPTLDEWRTLAAPVLPDKPDPIFSDPNLQWASDYLIEGLPSRKLEASGSFKTTDEGIGDLDGNVWEWTSTCATEGGDSVPADRCPAFYVMGEHEAAMSFLIRDPARGGCAMGVPPAHLGLRLISDPAKSFWN